MDHNVEATVDEDSHNRPSKKAKCSESTALESDEQINGDPFTSPPSPIISTSSPVSESSETSGFKSDEQIHDNLLPSLPSSTMSTLSPVSGLMNEEKVSLDDDKQSDEHKQIVDERYDYLPQDYALTERDLCAHVIIETSLENDLLVKIDDISVKQHQLVCLLDDSKWLNDDVISAYICCIKDQAHVQNKNDGKVYFENPFISRLLKRDGSIGIHEDGTFMTDIVRNYLKYDMIHLPINIYNKHWYLAIVNAKKSEIQVLDSLCWEFDRNDLTITLRGLQCHLDIIRSQQDLISHKWTDLDVTKWTITEQLREPIQEDSTSCGLFMLKFMEYSTEDTLSQPITQEIITPFRYKLASILLSWKTNTAAMTTMLEQRDYIEEDPNDVVMLESRHDQNKANQLTSLSVESKFQSLISVISNMSLHALVGGLCDYIKSINSTETLENVWVQSSKPYLISMTLKKLQEILNDDLPMDRNCFNLVIRKIMFDDIEMVKKKRGKISKHYLDMQFWVITDFGRHPKFRKKLDVEQLAYSVRSWPGINYSVSTCKSIHIPVQSNGDFIVFILDKDTRTINILDPSPLDPIYQYNPHAKYVHKLLWVAEYLPKAMSKACPGSRWNENVFLWKQKILNNIPVHNTELSGYLVPFFMSTWEDEKLHLPFSKMNVRDGCELRKQTLGHLLTFKDNECENNMPAGVLELVRCIKEAQRRSSIGAR